MTEGLGLGSRAVIGMFYQRLEVATGESWVDRVSMLFDSDQPSEDYKWLGQTPALREWVGGREAKGLTSNGITIRNRKFEATLRIPVDWVRRDKTGQIMVRVNELADRTVSHYASLISTLINSGTTAVCYDGQFFFDTDHAEGKSGTQSNDLSVDISETPANVRGTPTAPSPEECRNMVMAGVQSILGFKDNQGEPMNEAARAFQVMVPSSYFQPAAAALGNPVLGGGDTNVLTNLDGYTFGLAVNPRLTANDAINVFRTDGSAAPFIRQEEEGVMVSAIAEGSEHEFKHDEHLYGVKAQRNAGYGYWQHACRVQAT